MLLPELLPHDYAVVYIALLSYLSVFHHQATYARDVNYFL
jgi:hypothetical protein